MHVLSRLRLRTKLALLLGLASLAVVTAIAAASSMLHQRMIDDRVDKLRTASQMAVGLAQSLQAEVAAHRITREQAMAQFRNAAHAIRFDSGLGYIVGQETGPNGMMIFHGANPGLENKPPTARDASGTLVSDLIRDALRGSSEGVISYRMPKPGQSEPQPKVSFVTWYAPWNLAFVLGAYTDDVDAAFHAQMLRLSMIGGTILVVTLLIAWLINRDITASLNALKSAMARLSSGELDVVVPGTNRRDEVGAMANAVVVFKQAMQRAAQFANEQQKQAEQERIEAAKHTALLAVAETIEAEAKSALGEVAERTHAMAEAINEMSASAARTGTSAEGAVGAAASALTIAQTVASAAEELAASIREIAGQVSHSNTMVSRAVEAGRVTRNTISALNEQVGRIGAVADMISEIAARTNLLALNATIEAARAGDAGKGFAVVASEVKQLANQTARSTEEISRHIGEVRSATGASVAAVNRIEETITEINAISASIAAAVEEQGAATAEIARNVAETATAANEMTSRTHDVSVEATHTGKQVFEVRENVASLEAAMHALHNTVIHLVRSATADMDRRRYRRRPCLVQATLNSGGQSVTASLQDISERGCYAVTSLECRSGQSLTLSLAGFGTRLEGTIVEQEDGGLHITFLGEGLTKHDADRISLTTISDLVGAAKQDHLAFVKRVVDIVAAGEKVSPDTLASQHHCRLGCWYDGVGDGASLALPSFKAMKAPHAGVHESGRRALACVVAGNSAAAQEYVAKMRAHSDRVLQCLDDFGRGFPETFRQEAQPATAA